MPAPIPKQGPKQTATAEPDSDELWLKGPLPGGARYKIFVTKEMGPKEIGKLIKVLEAQKLVLEDDDDEAAE